MELTQQNLLRVGDIVAEIDRSLASLKRQAAKAERYVAYRNEVEDLQLHEASHRYLELAGWIKFEGGLVEELTEEDARTRTELATREGELEATRLDVHAAEERLDAAQNASFAADNAVRAEEAAIERAKDRLAGLTQRERQAEAEKGEMSAQATRLAAERDVVSGEVVTLQGEESAQAAHVAEEEASLADLAAAHGAADARVAEKRQAIARVQAEIASTEAKLTGFERRQAEMAARRDRLRAERESLDGARVEHAARAEELARSIDDLRAGRVTTVADKARLELRLAELKEIIQTQEKALDESKSELSKKRSRHGALEEMHARLDGVGAGTKALVGHPGRVPRGSRGGSGRGARRAHARAGRPPRRPAAGRRGPRRRARGRAPRGPGARTQGTSGHRAAAPAASSPVRAPADPCPMTRSWRV